GRRGGACECRPFRARGLRSQRCPLYPPIRRRLAPALTQPRPADYQTAIVCRRLPSPANRGRLAMMNPFLWLVHTLIWLYIYILIAAAVLSWLIAFNVVNSHNPTVRMIWDFVYRITEPGLRPIRSILPNLGGTDISPVSLIIGLTFLEQFIVWAFVSLFGCMR